MGSKVSKTPLNENFKKPSEFSRIFLIIILPIFLALIPITTEAHFPLIAGDKHHNKNNALTIEKIHISKVMYQSISKAKPESWINFEVSAETNLDIEIGLPKLDRLKNFRPTVEIITPENESIFIHTSKIHNPESFHEPYTDTESWILIRQSLKLHSTGTYFIKSFSTSEDGGKLWIAVGKEESFGVGELTKLVSIRQSVREFHELNVPNSSFNFFYLLVFSAILGGIIIFIFKIIRRQLKEDSSTL